MNSAEIEKILAKIGREKKLCEIQKRLSQKVRKPFFDEKIETLEKQEKYWKKKLKRVSKIKEKQTILIPWTNILFANGFVNVDINGKYYSKSLKKSRKSFNYLKPLLYKLAADLEVVLYENSVVQITNLEELEKVVAFLEIKTILNHLSSLSIAQTRELSLLYKYISKGIPELCFPKSKSKYLEFLINSQVDQKRIIPIQEIFLRDEGNYIEDGFLFTIEGSNCLLIIWENINIDRATYVFTTSSQTYAEDIQNVFDLALAKIKNKRSHLHSDKDFWMKNIPLYKIVNHTNLFDWKTSLRY
ncbi:MAG: hypothetical protein KDE33_23370 [Bacteroidetes bacterium]|nr:hypothetical protein [Bacteroidota bacterium]MCB0835314.1 hypothetical protein [Bacteroidota bacterium]